MIDILMDVDGPLACFTEAFLDAVLQETGRAFSIADVHQYDIAGALGLEKSVVAKIYDTYLRAQHFCLDIEPQSGAREGLDRLRKVANVYACTTPIYRSPYWMAEREIWLAEHMGFDPKHVIFASAKHLLHGDMIVDDKVSHVDAWSRRHPDGLAVLWKMRYNEAEREAAGDKFRYLTIWTSEWEHLYELAAKRGGGK